MISTFDTCYTLSTPAFSLYLSFFFVSLFCFFILASFFFPTLFPPFRWRVRMRRHRLARVTAAMEKGNGATLEKEDGVTWERGSIWMHLW